MSRALVSLLLLPCFASAQTLPIAEDADWPNLSVHARELLSNLNTVKAPLSAGAKKAIDVLLAQKKPDDPAAACTSLQKLLDEQCLLGVHINPESRVKARRGPMKPLLHLGSSTLVLVKVHNEGGVRHALSVSSPEKFTNNKESGWLELEVLNDKPFANRLSGDRVEYRVLKLTARQSGKREATLAFDAGQGSQDLGFRAEVPILFTIREGKK